MRRLLFLYCSLLASPLIFSQLPISVATDLSVLKSLKKNQRFWAVGQTVHMQFHFSMRQAGYINFSYYTPGKFRNKLVAEAKSPGTIPQQINFTSEAAVRFRHISMGVRHYLKGTHAVNAWTLYGSAGFGLLFGSVENIYSRPIDTALYNLPASPARGTGNFKRLTFDLALGWEIPISLDIYLYMEARTWLPTSDYPSKYLFINNDAPLPVSANAGIRILFDRS